MEDADDADGVVDDDDGVVDDGDVDDSLVLEVSFSWISVMLLLLLLQHKYC